MAAVFADAGGFLRTLGPTLVSSTSEQAVLRLDAGPALHNHVGGPHAAALFGLGELTAFALMLKAFGDEVKAGAVPLIKSGAIEFKSIVTGPVLSTATLVGDPDAVSARFAERGSASFEVAVEIAIEEGGAITTLMRPTMSLKRF